ncbi:protein TIFY 7 [Sesamum angolense]|uniref:Protein TIFY 7 n=1 Tax=Sesamum angolense TaxID=2727404 RepID=A0AAE1WVA9_9LAMI|nr:protein TIFY 7 [Sesamum angolense]
MERDFLGLNSKSSFAAKEEFAEGGCEDSAVPQSRKASLARFLEKRKERVMSAAPYNLSKNTSLCGTPESTGFGFSTTSGVGSSSVSINKETGSEP